MTKYRKGEKVEHKVYGKGSLVTGTFAEILSLIAMTIDKLKNDGIDKEGLIEAFLLGITDKKIKKN